MAPPQVRRIAGVAFVDTVKFLKNYERTHGPVALNGEARAVLATRVLASEWYPVETFHALLAGLDKAVFKGSEQRALELGATRGTALRGAQNAYVKPGDPLNSVLAMRHAWRAHYDFGALTAEITSEGAVMFTVEDYPDIPMTHALITAGWGVGAARAAGSQSASAEIVERPWRSGERYVYKIHP